MSWALEILAAGNAYQGKVGGLSLPLRLALDAQKAGARAVFTECDEIRRQLEDERLTLPVDTSAQEERILRVPANLLVHRQTFKNFADERTAALNLGPESPAPGVAYDFAPLAVIDNPSRRRAESLLFRSLRKTQDGWTSRWLNRYISLTVSRLLVETSLTPNQVSLSVLGLGLVGAYLASQGGYAELIAGATLFQFQSIFDGCDGELSRVTHRGSHLGAWLDTIGDDVTNYAFFAAAGYGIFTYGEDLIFNKYVYLIAAGITVVSGLIASTLEYRYLIRIGSGDLLDYPLTDPETENQENLFSWIRPLFKRDTFVFLTWVSALAGRIGEMLVVFSVGALGILISVFKAELRMAKERQAPRGVS